MEKFIELIAILILTIIGFVLPIVSLLLSIFNEGVQKLSVQYSIEKEKSEENIKNQLQKINKLDNDNITGIKSNLKELEKIKKTAQNKLDFLNPRKQIIKLSVPLFMSFLLVSLFFVFNTIDFKINWLPNVGIRLIFPFFGIISFAYSLGILWKLLGIITEVIGYVNSSKKETETKVIELLSLLVEKTTSQSDLYLKKVYLNIDSHEIKDDSFSLELHSDEKSKLKIKLDNQELRMAKDVEFGLVIPTEFLIEKDTKFSIYNDSESQVIRFNTTAVHGRTMLNAGDLSLTPLKKGSFFIRTFIKAENIETVYKKIAVKIL